MANPSDKATHDKLVSLVDQMLDTQKKLHSAESEREKEMHAKQADAIDRQIDNIVYSLYGLTNEEIAIVEKSS